MAGHPLPRPALALLLIFWLASTAAGCRDTVAPPPDGEVAIVSTGDTPWLSVVDSSGHVVARITSIPKHNGSLTRSPDSSMLYLAAADEQSPPQLIALDLRSLQIAWRDTGFSNGAHHNVVDGIEIYGVQGMAPSPDGTHLFIASAYRGAAGRDSAPGLAVLDIRTHRRLAWVGPFYVEPGGVVALPPGPAALGGAILVLGHRTARPDPYLDWLFVLDPSTLTVVDSAAPAPGVSLGSSLYQVLPTADGRFVYLQGASKLYKYDLVAHQVVATTPRPSNGQLVLSPDGSTLYLTDAGRFFDYVGSGLLHVFGSALEPQAPIDLRESASADGNPPQTHGAAISRDGKRLYVAAGTALTGPLYDPQPARVLIIDTGTGKVLGSVPLHEWNPGAVVVR